MTDAEWQAWLESFDAIRCVIVEAAVHNGTSETTLYFSNRGYVTKPADTPSNQYYKPIISDDVTFREAFNLDGSPSLAFGDIILNNSDSSIDTYIGYTWEGRDLTVKYGDPTWDYSDFRVIFQGKTEKLDTKDSKNLIIRARDKLQQLNTPMTDVTLGGATENADKLIPLTFGEVCNVTPLLTDPATHEYQVHNGAIEDIIEVRDFGYPLTGGSAPTKSLATGKFTLAAQPAGTITCSVQGDKNSTYNSTIASIIEHIVKNYGVNSLSAGDINTTNFSSFDSAHTQKVGIYLDGRENVLDVISVLADAVGAVVYMSRLGKLTLFQLDFPPSGTATDITDSEIIEDSLSLTQVLDIKAAVKLGYCRNYTIQRDLQTGIIEEHKDLFAKEWMTTTQTDTATATLYNLEEDDELIGTALLKKTEAETESTRRLTMRKSRRLVYSFQGSSKLLSLELGDRVNITSKHYSLSAQDGVIVGMDINWTKAYMQVEVMI